MPEKIEEVIATVLKRITPQRRERAKVEELAEKLEREVVSASKEFHVETEVRVEGSVAKDTWLSKEPDVDVFMRVPTSMPRKSLGDICLKIARKATEGSRQVERFAEHPYLEATVNDTRVNIVPCYKVERGEWRSATDRTPFHTDYVKKNLSAKMKGEIRLLKKFMKEIGVYGAEIRVGGFSGYLCELLILHYKSFTNTLKAFSQHKDRIIVDFEGHYRGRENELELLFNAPIIVVDPVDRVRNVSSAVHHQKLYTFMAAARAFLKNPRTEFFAPPETTALSKEKLKETLQKRGSTTVFLVFGEVNAVPDVLWGQLYKSQRSLLRQVQLECFRVLRSLSWSDEKTLNMFIFELEQRFISPVKKHLGPPLKKEEECEKFLQKHVKNLNTISGPYVEDGRWVVQLRRKHVDVVELFNRTLKNGGRTAGVAKEVSKVLRGGFKILVNEEITEVYCGNSRFAKFLTEFLSGKPKWLETE